MPSPHRQSRRPIACHQVGRRERGYLTGLAFLPFTRLDELSWVEEARYLQMGGSTRDVSECLGAIKEREKVEEGTTFGSAQILRDQLEDEIHNQLKYGRASLMT
jgi:hypothetical protein